VTLRVTVPATSANLGPGFDAFGVAIDLYLTVTAGPRGDQRVRSIGEGEGELPTDESNLVWRALRSYCVRFGVDVPDVTLTAENEIPLERGLGSSSAAAVAGVTLGRALTSGGGRDQDLIDLAAQLEGHPDNAAPAVLGGLVVCHEGTAIRLEPTDWLVPVLCVPSSRQGTTSARAILPRMIPLRDAAANGARAAIVLAGLAGALAWNPAAMWDVLHEPPRFEVMTASGHLVRTLRAAGIGACLSGAGSSVLAVVSSGDGEAVGMIRQAVGQVPGELFDVRPSRWDLAGASVGRDA
jgi:homoserine kinase